MARLWMILLSKWTLEIYHELQTSDLELTDADIREALDIVIYGKPDYNISMHKLLQHSHGILHRIGNKLHSLP